MVRIALGILILCLNPNPCMHIISSFALSILSAKTDDDFKKKDIVPAISLFFMYCAFYCENSEILRIVYSYAKRNGGDGDDNS